MKIIVICFVAWLIYDYYKDRKIEKELREIKQNSSAHPTEKGGER